MKQVKCGCEFNADTLISLCDSHAAYFAAKFIKSKAPEVAPLTSKQEALRNAILTATAPAVVGKKTAQPIDAAAANLVAFATAVAART